MMGEKFRAYVAVYGFLEREGKIFLMRRANTGYRDGQYGPPSGHVEAGESLMEALLREVSEEAGIDVPVDGVECVHAAYRRAPQRTYADYYFTCKGWQGDPKIMEADKCDHAVWFDKNDLPKTIVEEVGVALGHICNGVKFSEITVREG